MGRTNIVIDDALIAEAMRLTGSRTKRQAVDIALRRLVEKGTLYPMIRRLRGEFVWEGDVEAGRTARSRRT